MDDQKPKTINLRLPADMVKRLDEWRKKYHRPIKQHSALLEILARGFNASECVPPSESGGE